MARVLPIRVPVLPGESLDSWLEALARRNGLTLTAFLRVLGITPGYYTRQLVTDLPPELVRRLEACTATPAGRLDQAVVAPRFPFEPNRERNCRFCPQCLTEHDRRWQLSWWLPWVFACTTHHALLHDTCPNCHAGLRTSLPSRTHQHSTATCLRRIAASSGTTGATRVCGADLAAAEALTLGPRHPLVATQQWIEELLDQPDPVEAHAVLADLNACTRWLLRTIDHLDLVQMGDLATNAWRDSLSELVTPSGRLRPYTAVVRGVVAHTARAFLDVDDNRDAIAAVRELRGRRPNSTNAIPGGMAQAEWDQLSPRTRRRFLHAADPVMRPIERVRLCSGTPRAAQPDSAAQNATRRVRRVPQLFWSGWTVRLMPRHGIQEGLFRGVAAALLLVPGEPTLNARGITDRLHPYLPNALAGTLRLAIAGGHDDVLTAICNLAHYLDTNPVPIDYQRRRDLVPAEPITLQAWRQLCFATGTQPGERAVGPNQTPRFVQAQRYLHQLLTGSDLADPTHPLAWKNPSDRGRYQAFLPSLTLDQRDALNDNGRRVLEELGIDEPLTWEPPAECAVGLALPGPDPADIDLDAVRRIVFDEQRPASAAARELGTTLTHVRYALQHTGAPARDWTAGSSPLTAWRRRQRAAALLTSDFLQREYTDGGKTFTQIAGELDIPRGLVLEYARAHGITIHRTRRPIPIDDAWLRDQYLTHKRSTASIATELGTNDGTIRRRLQRLGIPLRPAGVHSRQAMTITLDRRVPRDVRAAAQGNLHGWLRLHRFQIAMAFPSLETAATYLNTHQGALVRQFQRLERDIGAPLFHRGVFGKPHRPTPRGNRLLQHLDTGHVKTQLHAALSAQLVPMPDPATIAAATSTAATRRPPSPPRPYTGINVQRIRIRPETLTLLQDLISHAEDDIYAAQVSARTGLNPGSVSTRLRQLEHAGWLTSRLEDDISWLNRAPAGRGPGRRRTYYTLTSEGRRAAIHELQTRTPAKAPT
nr:TniQ family protein [Kribbella shirazensis]